MSNLRDLDGKLCNDFEYMSAEKEFFVIMLSLVQKKVTACEKSTGKAISETYTMSIKSTVYNMIGGTYNDLMIALMKFGDASKTAFG